MFKKYEHIDNTYQKKQIAYWTELYPEILKEEFVLEEKIHGTNIQIFFGKYGEYYRGSRNRKLDDGQNHMGLQEVLDKMIDFLSFGTAYSKTKKVNLRFYGELFGGNIQKNVDYGKEKRLIFFNLEIDGIRLSQRNFYALMEYYGMSQYRIKTANKILTFHNAITESPVFESMYSVKEKDPEFRFSEGYILKPYNRNFMDKNGDFFYLKNKNEKFKEITCTRKRPKKISNPKTPNPKTPNPLLPYINENRMNSVFSKEGKIKNKSEIGKYIKLLTKDAIIDYNKDHNKTYDEFLKENGLIGQIGGRIAQLLISEIE